MSTRSTIILFLKTNTRWHYLIVFTLALIVGVFADLSYLLYLTHVPKDTVYLGITHYISDYVVYLSQFAQGTNGAWMNHNLFTEELTNPTLLHFPNIMFGKLGGLLHLSPITSYHLSVIGISMSIVISAFVVFRRIFPLPHLAFTALLFYICSEPFMNKLPPSAPVPYYPYELWNTPQYISSRFSSAPHYLMQTLLFFILLFLLFNKNRMKSWIRFILTFLVAGGLTILQPMIATVIVCASCIVFIPSAKKHWKILLGMGLGYILAVIYVNGVTSVPPYSTARLWESVQQTKTTIPFLLSSIGPIFFFTIIGMAARIRKATPIEWMGILLCVGAYSIFASPIPEKLGISNVRILTAGYYLWLAWFAAVGLQTITGWLSTMLHIKKPIFTCILLGLFFFFVGPTIGWEIQNKLPRSQSLYSPIQYIPKTTYQAFEFLKSQGSSDDVVLTNPLSFMDMITPALSGHKTVVGTDQVTIDFETKRQEAERFFYNQMDVAQAQQFILAHHITYILFTSFEGNVETFQNTYPFLISIYKNQTATVYKVHK